MCKIEEEATFSKIIGFLKLQQTKSNKAVVIFKAK